MILRRRSRPLKSMSNGDVNCGEENYCSHGPTNFALDLPPGRVRELGTATALDVSDPGSQIRYEQQEQLSVLLCGRQIVDIDSCSFDQARILSCSKYEQREEYVLPTQQQLQQNSVVQFMLRGC